MGSDNGLLPGHRQAIIATNGGILLIGALGINFCEILIEINTFSLKKMYLQMLSVKWQPFCPGGDELMKRTPGLPYGCLQFYSPTISASESICVGDNGGHLPFQVLSTDTCELPGRQQALGWWFTAFCETKFWNWIVVFCQALLLLNKVWAWMMCHFGIFCEIQIQIL